MCWVVRKGSLSIFYAIGKIQKINKCVILSDWI